MKKLLVPSMCLLLSCLFGSAMAAPNAKSTILHCGCNLAGDGMVWSEISISSNSRGHDNHVVGTIDSCFDGVETYTDVVRLADDCQVDGPPLRDPIAECPDEAPIAGDPCGALPVTP